MSTRKIIGLSGAGLLFVGVFLPMFHIPIVGSLNYFQNGEGDGLIVLLMALLSFVLSLVGKFRWLLIPATISALTLTVSFVVFQGQISTMKAGMEKDLSGNPYRGLADMFVQSYQIEWGMAVLVLGIVLIIAAAVMRPSPKERCAQDDDLVSL